MKVRFIEVGRSRMSWEAELPNCDEERLVREIKRKGALASQGIGVHAGVIYAGFRPVGYVEVVEVAK